MKLLGIGLWVLVLGSTLVLSVGYSLECSKGPSQWCQNLASAKNCNAVRHCIQTVWEKQDVPEDNDSICKICLDMVKQARDQLQSNETINDIKAVFEGSCLLIPLKPVQKECIKLADDFVVELVETLSSEMNPQVVCSVAGLCNNVKIDKMLKEYKPTLPHLSCGECGRVAEVIAIKFKIADRDDMLDAIMNLCGHASSFSDACANIALTYFNELYDYFTQNLNANGICHLSGTCVEKYHQHSDAIEVRSRSDIGVVPLKDDIPCELCQQLVHHLQELLTANTTELEFKEILEGLCKQTKGFKTECLSIVDQYSDKIYNTLVNNLDANGACFLIGICPKGNNNGYFLSRRDIIPLIPYIEPAKITVKIMKLPKENSTIYSEKEMNNAQLPIDKLMGAMNPGLLRENGQMCTLCEYFLHFLQETLATPASEDEIKETVTHLCDRFPISVRGECHNFVDMYGDAIIALAIQDMDPRTVCPKISLCPKNNNEDVNVFSPQPVDVSINERNEHSDKPTCPLCLFAVQQAQELIKDNKSKSNIKRVLDNLCTHLPNKLRSECVDFVETYSNELVDMLITDFTPQQICVYIKLCPPSKTESSKWGDLGIEVDDDILNSRTDKESDEDTDHANPECLLCEKVINEAEKKIGPKKSKDEIKKALNNACDRLYKMKAKCHKYVTEYGDKIADLILKEVAPMEICRILGYCFWNLDKLTSSEAVDEISIESKIPEYVIQPDDKSDPPTCVLCEFILTKLEAELKDKKTQDEIKHEVENICNKMPKTVSASCNQFVEKYGDLIISLLETVPPKQICQKLKLCKAMDTSINDKIIDCGVCHGATKTLVPYINEVNVADLQMMTEVACDDLPAQYFNKCSQLLELYGPSIFNLIKAKTHQSEICAKIGKCFNEAVSGLAYSKLEDNPNREKRESDTLLGSNKCTYGPAHWCANKENARSCGTIEFCEKKVWKNVNPKV